MVEACLKHSPIWDAAEKLELLDCWVVPRRGHQVQEQGQVLDNEQQYILEFVNSLTPSGFPPHVLNLKKHTSMMLIRNLHLHDVNGC